MVLLLKAGDGEGSLVLLVPLLRQVEPVRATPGDRWSWRSTCTAGEGDLLSNALHVLVLWLQLYRWWVPNMHLRGKKLSCMVPLSFWGEKIKDMLTCITPEVPLVPWVL